MRLRRTCALALTLACAVGCSTAPAEEAPSSSAGAIAGGTVIADSEYPSVVRVFTHGPGCIYLPDRAALCSGTLIGQSTVVTAAHCVLGADVSETWIMTGSSTDTANDRAIPGTAAGRIFASSIDIHPEVLARIASGDIDCTQDNVPGSIDLAVIHLATPVPASTPGLAKSGVMLSLPSRGFPVVGLPVTHVGAGFPSWNGTGNTDFGIRRKGAAAVQPEEWSTQESAKICTSTGGSFELITAPSIVRYGDSGGPGFMTVNGQELLAGVHSWGWETGDHMAPTYSAANSTFLRKALGVVGFNGNDTDCDGIGDPLDDCVGTWNFYQEDGDSDSVGDACDNCAAAKNPGQENCNYESEDFAGVPHVGDVCDPVPCLRTTQAAQQSASPYIQITNTMSFDVEPIRVKPAGGNELRGAWGHRFCKCDVQDPTPYKCAMLAGCSFGDDFDPDGPNWMYTKAGIDDPPALNATFEHDFRAPAELQPNGLPKTLDRMHWSEGTPGSIFSVSGSHWFHVRKEACETPPCAPSGVTQETLDTLASHYWAGSAGTQYVFVGVAMVIPNIFSWWNPPVPDCVMCGALDVTPVAQVLPDGSLAMRGPAGDYPIASMLTDVAQKTLLSTTGVTWLAPAEGSFLLDGATYRLASVKADGSAVGPILRALRAGGLDAVTSSATSGPKARSKFGAVLRATVGDVLVIGGITGEGLPAKDIWRYDIGADAWSRVQTDGQIEPGTVLAATYDGFSHQVLVLDDVGTGTDRKARLWTVDTFGGGTRLLGAWARSGTNVAFALGYGHDGLPVLLASQGLGLPLKIAQLAITSDGVTVSRVVTSNGVPLAPPRPSARGIDVLLNRVKREAIAERVAWEKLAAPTREDAIGNLVE